MTDDVSRHSSELDPTAVAIGALSATTDAMGKDIEDIHGRLRTVERTLSKNGAKLDVIEAAVTDTPAALDRMSKSIDALAGRTKDLEVANEAAAGQKSFREVMWAGVEKATIAIIVAVIVALVYLAITKQGAHTAVPSPLTQAPAAGK